MRLYVDPERLGGPEIPLRETDARYLLGVLRLRVGDRLTVFDGRGREAEAEVAAAARTRATLRVGAPRTVETRRLPRVTLLVALLKGAKMDWVVEKATELGVERIRPILCARAVPRPEDARARVRRWTRIAREAARQSGRADAPAVDAPAPIEEAIGDARPSDARRVLLDGDATDPIARKLVGATEALLAVGPEGGFTPGEVERALAAGFETAHLGATTLRAETAAIVACAAATAIAPGLDGREGSAP